MQNHFSNADAPPGWISRWNQLNRQIRHQLGERYALADLTESRAAVLQSLLHDIPNFTQSDLASELCLSESNLCSLIERMRQDGLLERTRSPLDRRKSVLTLTEAGRKRCQAIDQIHREFEADVLAATPHQLQSEIARILLELGLELQALESAHARERRAA